MSEFIVVDTDRVNNLSREFSALASELRDEAARFRDEALTTRGSYGHTAEAESAESEYQRTAREALSELEQLERQFLDAASVLADQARNLVATERDAALLASSLNAPVS